jgi:hypothetical protein
MDRWIRVRTVLYVSIRARIMTRVCFLRHYFSSHKTTGRATKLLPLIGILISLLITVISLLTPAGEENESADVDDAQQVFLPRLPARYGGLFGLMSLHAVLLCDRNKAVVVVHENV